MILFILIHFYDKTLLTRKISNKSFYCFISAYFTIIVVGYCITNFSNDARELDIFTPILLTCFVCVLYKTPVRYKLLYTMFAVFSLVFAFYFLMLVSKGEFFNFVFASETQNLFWVEDLNFIVGSSAMWCLGLITFRTLSSLCARFFDFVKNQLTIPFIVILITIPFISSIALILLMIDSVVNAASTSFFLP